MLQFLCLGLSQVKTVEFTPTHVVIEPFKVTDSSLVSGQCYRVSTSTLTQTQHIQVLGENTSGQAAAVFVSMKNGLWLTVGSDHVDVSAQSYSMALAKQLCPKVLSDQAWRFDEVKAHLSEIRVRSWVVDVGKVTNKRAYQDSALLPEKLLETKLASLAVGSVLFLINADDTVDACPIKTFVMQLFDPVLNRTIEHRYEVECLEKIS
jgi:hypothetical protein